MATFGFHASHEQFAPRELLDLVRAAQHAGFGAAMCSDHFMPWTDAQGQSGHAWSWLGAALEATTLPFGVVNAPGARYHPAVVAQAGATLAALFPGRFWLAVGSGEHLNEHVTGAAWPRKDERNARLRECVDVIRALWRGETITHRGRVTVEDAKLYSLPATPPPLFGAALSAETAAWVGEWADGLVTVSRPIRELEAVIEAFRSSAGADKPMHVQVKVAYDTDDERARAGAHEQWRALVLDGDVLAELRLPAEFEAAARHVRREDVERAVHVSADPARHVEWMSRYVEMGFAHVYVHNVTRAQRAFVEAYGEHVLPALVHT